MANCFGSHAPEDFRSMLGPFRRSGTHLPAPGTPLVAQQQPDASTPLLSASAQQRQQQQQVRLLSSRSGILMASVEPLEPHHDDTHLSVDGEEGRWQQQQQQEEQLFQQHRTDALAGSVGVRAAAGGSEAAAAGVHAEEGMGAGASEGLAAADAQRRQLQEPRAGGEAVGAGALGKPATVRGAAEVVVGLGEEARAMPAAGSAASLKVQEASMLLRVASVYGAGDSREPTAAEPPKQPGTAPEAGAARPQRLCSPADARPPAARRLSAALPLAAGGAGLPADAAPSAASEPLPVRLYLGRSASLTASGSATLSAGLGSPAQVAAAAAVARAMPHVASSCGRGRGSSVGMEHAAPRRNLRPRRSSVDAVLFAAGGGTGAAAAASTPSPLRSGSARRRRRRSSAAAAAAAAAGEAAGAAALASYRHSLDASGSAGGGRRQAEAAAPTSHVPQAQRRRSVLAALSRVSITSTVSRLSSASASLVGGVHTPGTTGTPAYVLRGGLQPSVILLDDGVEAVGVGLGVGGDVLVGSLDGLSEEDEAEAGEDGAAYGGSGNVDRTSVLGTTLPPYTAAAAARAQHLGGQRSAAAAAMAAGGCAYGGSAPLVPATQRSTAAASGGASAALLPRGEPAAAAAAAAGGGGGGETGGGGAGGGGGTTGQAAVRRLRDPLPLPSGAQAQVAPVEGADCSAFSTAAAPPLAATAAPVAPPAPAAAAVPYTRAQSAALGLAQPRTPGLSILISGAASERMVAKGRPSNGQAAPPVVGLQRMASHPHPCHVPDGPSVGGALSNANTQVALWGDSSRLNHGPSASDQSGLSAGHLLGPSRSVGPTAGVTFSAAFDALASSGHVPPGALHFAQPSLQRTFTTPSRQLPAPAGARQAGPANRRRAPDGNGHDTRTAQGEAHGDMLSSGEAGDSGGGAGGGGGGGGGGAGGSSLHWASSPGRNLAAFLPPPLLQGYEVVPAATDALVMGDGSLGAQHGFPVSAPFAWAMQGIRREPSGTAAAYRGGSAAARPLSYEVSEGAAARPGAVPFGAQAAMALQPSRSEAWGSRTAGHASGDLQERGPGTAAGVAPYGAFDGSPSYGAAAQPMRSASHAQVWLAEGGGPASQALLAAGAKRGWTGGGVTPSGAAAGAAAGGGWSSAAVGLLMSARGGAQAAPSAQGARPMTRMSMSGTSLYTLDAANFSHQPSASPPPLLATSSSFSPAQLSNPASARRRSALMPSGLLALYGTADGAAAAAAAVTRSTARPQLSAAGQRTIGTPPRVSHLGTPPLVLPANGTPPGSGAGGAVSPEASGPLPNDPFTDGAMARARAGAGGPANTASYTAVLYRAPSSVGMEGSSWESPPPNRAPTGARTSVFAKLTSAYTSHSGFGSLPLGRGAVPRVATATGVSAAAAAAPRQSSGHGYRQIQAPESAAGGSERAVGGSGGGGSAGGNRPRRRSSAMLFSSVLGNDDFVQLLKNAGNNDGRPEGIIDVAAPPSSLLLQQQQHPTSGPLQQLPSAPTSSLYGGLDGLQASAAGTSAAAIPAAAGASAQRAGALGLSLGRLPSGILALATMEEGTDEGAHSPDGLITHLPMDSTPVPRDSRTGSIRLGAAPRSKTLSGRAPSRLQSGSCDEREHGTWQAVALGHGMAQGTADRGPTDSPLREAQRERVYGEERGPRPPSGAPGKSFLSGSVVALAQDEEQEEQKGQGQQGPSGEQIGQQGRRASVAAPGDAHSSLAAVVTAMLGLGRGSARRRSLLGSAGPGGSRAASQHSGSNLGGPQGPALRSPVDRLSPPQQQQQQQQQQPASPRLPQLPSPLQEAPERLPAAPRPGQQQQEDRQPHPRPSLSFQQRSLPPAPDSGTTSTPRLAGAAKEPATAFSPTPPTSSSQVTLTSPDAPTTAAPSAPTVAATHAEIAPDAAPPPSNHAQAAAAMASPSPTSDTDPGTSWRQAGAPPPPPPPSIPHPTAPSPANTDTQGRIPPSSLERPQEPVPLLPSGTGARVEGEPVAGPADRRAPSRLARSDSGPESRLAEDPRPKPRWKLSRGWKALKAALTRGSAKGKGKGGADASGKSASSSSRTVSGRGGLAETAEQKRTRKASEAHVELLLAGAPGARGVNGLPIRTSVTLPVSAIAGLRTAGQRADGGSDVGEGSREASPLPRGAAAQLEGSPAGTRQEGHGRAEKRGQQQEAWASAAAGAAAAPVGSTRLHATGAPALPAAPATATPHADRQPPSGLPIAVSVTPTAAEAAGRVQVTSPSVDNPTSQRHASHLSTRCSLHTLLSTGPDASLPPTTSQTAAAAGAAAAPALDPSHTPATLLMTPCSPFVAMSTLDSLTTAPPLMVLNPVAYPAVAYGSGSAGAGLGITPSATTEPEPAAASSVLNTQRSSATAAAAAAAAAAMTTHELLDAARWSQRDSGSYGKVARAGSPGQGSLPGGAEGVGPAQGRSASTRASSMLGHNSDSRERSGGFGLQAGAGGGGGSRAASGAGHAEVAAATGGEGTPVRRLPVSDVR